ncbi:MAG: class I SAM-dependent methyltransferase [Candidatus Bathyarchaeia archaeon]
MAEWNHILLRKEYDPEEPDQIVVNLASMLKKRKAEKVLDLGCGAGRHVIYLAETGFETHGADISETGLRLTKKKLRSRRLEAQIVKCDMKSMPYIPSCFDAVVCVQTIYHQKLKGIQETLSEIHRILKKKGLLLANFHSKRSSRHGKGMEVEESTFMEEKGPEKGVLHHFVDEDELCELLRNFKINLEAKEKKTGSYLRSRLIVVAEKSSPQPSRQTHA